MSAVWWLIAGAGIAMLAIAIVVAIVDALRRPELPPPPPQWHSETRTTTTSPGYEDPDTDWPRRG